MVRGTVGTVLILSLFAAWGNAYGQIQHNTWYLGSDQGISFTYGVPQLFTGSSQNTWEGCASISDHDGQGIFYTNCQQVFDRTGAVMPNGDDMGGCTSSSQGAVIVPFNGESDRYYLFLVPAQYGQTCLWNTMTWSVVDMDLNGGYGDVTIKNQPLLAYATEQVIATPHANGRDAWVLARLKNSNAWYAYEVTCLGVSAPVVSHAGLIVHDTDTMQTVSAPGWMDVAPGGDRIASTWNDPTGGMSYMELLGFNNATGFVSGGSSIAMPSPGGGLESYSVCFSPSGSALYRSDTDYGTGLGHLTQYDMGAVDPLGTGVVVGEEHRVFGSMQTARDGKVYMGLPAYGFLARIDQPDMIGAGCGFVLNGIDLAPGLSPISLSNDWIQDTTPIDLIAWHDTTSCASSITIALTHAFEAPAPVIHWSTGAVGTSTTATSSGTYTVEAIFPCDTLRDTVTVIVVGSAAHDLLSDPESELCIGERLEFNAPSGYASYAWSNGAIDQNVVVMDVGLLWLEVHDTAGCAFRDSVLIVVGGCACDVYVPNAFTPDEDGHNDVFAMATTCALRDVDLRIFDRWGAELFRAGNANEGWNGDAIPIGLYPWLLRYSVWNGQRYEQRVERGAVALVR